MRVTVSEGGPVGRAILATWRREDPYRLPVLTVRDGDCSCIQPLTSCCDGGERTQCRNDVVHAVENLATFVATKTDTASHSRRGASKGNDDPEEPEEPEDEEVDEEIIVEGTRPGGGGGPSGGGDVFYDWGEGHLTIVVHVPVIFVDPTDLPEPGDEPGDDTDDDDKPDKWGAATGVLVGEAAAWTWPGIALGQVAMASIASLLLLQPDNQSKGCRVSCAGVAPDPFWSPRGSCKTTAGAYKGYGMDLTMTAACQNAMDAALQYAVADGCNGVTGCTQSPV